jgi:hypothetical protein
MEKEREMIEEKLHVMGLTYFVLYTYARGEKRGTVTYIRGKKPVLLILSQLKISFFKGKQWGRPPQRDFLNK